MEHEFTGSHSEIAAKLIESFLHVHRGYRVKSMVQESTGPVEFDWARNGGLKLLNDYQNWYLEASEKLPPAEEYPRLTGAFRENTSVATVPGMMFQTPAPRLRFSPRQKAVFLAALGGLENIRVAETLNIPLYSVQNAFRLAYQKVTDTPGMEEAVFRAGRVTSTVTVTGKAPGSAPISGTAR